MGAALHKAGRLGADWHGALRGREGRDVRQTAARNERKNGEGGGGRGKEGEGGAGPISTQRTKVPSADRATPTFMMTMGDT